MTNKYIVITTIHQKTEAIRRFEQLQDWHMVLVGDRKTPAIDSSANLTFLSLDRQQKLGYAFVEHCPYNHYARKNIGYLYAIEQGAEIIYDTDDDNLPYEHWEVPDFSCPRQYSSNRQFVNIYRYFTDEFIWPRGYPLDEIHGQTESKIQLLVPKAIGVWQGLVDQEPDVDAIFRLLFPKTLSFARKPSFFLAAGQYSPFNSQNTFWQPNAFPFLYLPATTSFRFTDILRSYIAQRLMWQEGLHLGFLSATVYQERNPHDLLKDFRDEVECYLNVKPIVRLLEQLSLEGEPSENVLATYSSLSRAGFVRAEEVALCRAWLADLERVKSTINKSGSLTAVWSQSVRPPT